MLRVRSPKYRPLGEEPVAVFLRFIGSCRHFVVSGRIKYEFGCAMKQKCKEINSINITGISLCLVCISGGNAQRL